MPLYRELLLDRRWQRRRLEVFRDANWRCQHCGNDRNEIPLHAHHRLYVPGHAPWEYQPGEIVSLCDPCHGEEHGKRESSPEIAELQQQIEEAHRRGAWDLMMKLAARAQELIEAGAFYKGLL